MGGESSASNGKQSGQGDYEMNMFRRLKSIASGGSSVSDNRGDFNIVRAKNEEKLYQRALSQHMEPSSLEAAANTSEVHDRAKKSAANDLSQLMNEMKIKDDNAHNLQYISKDAEPAVVGDNGTETGQIIMTFIGGLNGQPKQTISYIAERVFGTDSFGVVYQAKCVETGESVAIKRVLQDRRYKNRELQIDENYAA